MILTLKSRFVLGALALLIAQTCFVAHAEAANQIVVNLLGTADGYDRFVPDADGDGVREYARCFDVDLVELPSKLVIGKATDCLSNIEADVSGGIKLIGTTFFRLRHGTLVSRGRTTVQPTTHGSPGITHITGAIPAAGENSILRGTRWFKGASGSVRLSGAVNMTADGVLGPISFDCIFVIDLN